MADKAVKIGTIFNHDNKKKMKLGNQNPQKPEFDYTVQVRVLNSKGEVVAKATNPWVNLSDPHPKAPKNLVNDLVVWVPEET